LWCAPGSVRGFAKKVGRATIAQSGMPSSCPKGKQSAVSSFLPSKMTSDNEKHMQTATEKGNQMRSKGSNEVGGRIDTRALRFTYDLRKWICNVQKDGWPRGNCVATQISSFLNRAMQRGGERCGLDLIKTGVLLLKPRRLSISPQPASRSTTHCTRRERAVGPDCGAVCSERAVNPRRTNQRWT